MKINSNPTELWEAFGRCDEYNSSIDLYETVRRNENFFVGKQWEGLNAPDLEKPVLNFLKRVVSYFIAMIVTDDVGVSIDTFSDNEENQLACNALAEEVEKVIERENVKSLHRDFLRNMAVDGDACFYLWYDPNENNGQLVTGRIRIDNIENTKVLFGNPSLQNVQSQPYIIIVQRLNKEAVIEEGRLNGVPEDELDTIQADGEERYGEEKNNSKLVTVITTLVKDKGSVWACRSTQNCFVRPWWNTEYKLYPVAYGSWDKIRSSYHGMAAITGLIPNQIYVNKIWAMAMEQVKRTAFPKIIYNTTMFPNGWTSGAGKAVGVAGNPNDAVATSFRAADMSTMAIELVDRTISMTRDFMGASDAALGNVKPDNTSAIIAVQKATAMPLELQRLSYYQFVEDYVRIIIDMIRVHYGIRLVGIENPETNMDEEYLMDFSQIDYDSLELKVDIGTSQYWSELSQVQTMNNLFSMGIIQDAVTFLEGIPDNFLKNKNKIIAELKEKTNALPEMPPTVEDNQIVY